MHMQTLLNFKYNVIIKQFQQFQKSVLQLLSQLFYVLEQHTIHNFFKKKIPEMLMLHCYLCGEDGIPCS